MKAGGKREDEAVAPASRLHARRLTREVGRQLVVEGEDDRLFAREVAVQQPDADVRLPGDLPQGRRLVSAPGDQPHRCGVQAVSRLSAFSGPSWWTPPFSRLDIYSEH